jgi:hypothetical protein
MALSRRSPPQQKHRGVFRQGVQQELPPRIVTPAVAKSGKYNGFATIVT